MQNELFDFGLGGRITAIRDRLRGLIGDLPPAAPREPVETLVKSIISSRTRDEVSRKAYDDLVRLYPTWLAVMRAPEAEIAHIIREVTFPAEKARNLILALRHIHVRHPDFDLHFLDSEPLAKVMAWLTALPGVGPKVAAAALNFSTSERCAFVMDTHVLRVFSRLGIIGRKASSNMAYDLAMSALRTWTAAEMADLHSYIKLLGQQVCVAGIAHCRQCPILDLCISYRMSVISTAAPATCASSPAALPSRARAMGET